MASNEMQNFNLNDMERDVIGEVMNISMGSAATAMSTILDKKVNITTPRIETMPVEEFEFSYLEPVMGVLIKYVEGIDGTNILLMREDDLKMILGHLLSMDPEEMTELDEISISAISEIMNQMMGSAASALASFLGKTVNISPPEIIDTKNREGIRELFSITGDSLVSVKFNISIEGLIESEFISAMDPQLARKMVQMSMGASDLSAEEEEALAPLKELEAMEALDDLSSLGLDFPEAPADPVPEPAPANTAPPQSQPDSTTPAMDPAAAYPPPGYYPPGGYPPGNGYGPATGYPPAGYPPAQGYPQPGYPQPGYPQHGYPTQPEAPIREPIKAKDYRMKELGGGSHHDILADGNLDLVMSVPIQITVELGKTRKKIKDIADMTVGNIIELDRQAGDQVDVIANGRLIARGDVVVVDDNYSVRITEIIKNIGNQQETK